jgi:hypothetical protein
MTNKNLKKDLLKKLNITHQALSLRVKKLQKEIPMTTEDATYIIAHNEGLVLSKYLDNNIINQIRQIMPQKSQVIISRNSKRKINEQKVISVIITGSFKGTDPLLESIKLNEAKEMAAIYPLLYVLENSIRQFICQLMEKNYGSDWWDKEVSKKLKNTVSDRMKKEVTNSWHQKRGGEPIDYLDMKELPNIINRMGNKIAPKIIPSHEWFNQLIEEVYVSRCVLCHMNPLNKDSIDSVKLRFKQWQKQIKAKIDKIK